MAPLTSEFPSQPSDARFVGDPVDYVVFDGYTSAKDGDGGEVSVALVEVKSGNASLSREQKLVKRAVERGDVEWVTLKV